jgi:polygalacturonase
VTTPLVFLLVLSLAVAKPHPLLTSDHVCNVRDFGALGDNSTIDSSAIEKALHACSQYPFSVVFFAGPATYRINQSVVLRDHLTLLLDKNTTVFYDNKHYLDHHNTSTLQQTAACGIMGFMGGKNTPVICGKDL